MSTASKDNRSFVGCITVRPLAGCQISPEEYAGAAVRCYIHAPSREEAMSRLNEVLTEERIELVEIDFFVDEDAVEWENPDDPTGIQLSEEAKVTGDVIFGEFAAWGHDEEE
ncbi:MAG: hypothetical protein EOP84_04145 [Verrucomicrobiaceae bacterium]|nr:MAG: hypothetical protein EOP84_04145 [Verrucomicrobiaceae bacterium]